MISVGTILVGMAVDSVLFLVPVSLQSAGFIYCPFNSCRVLLIHLDLLKATKQ